MKYESDLLPTGNIRSYDSTYKLSANSQHIWCFILTFKYSYCLVEISKIYWCQYLFWFDVMLCFMFVIWITSVSFTVIVKFYLGTLGLRFLAWPSIEICFKMAMKAWQWLMIIHSWILYWLPALPVCYGGPLLAASYHEIFTRLRETNSNLHLKFQTRSSIANCCCHDPEILIWGSLLWLQTIIESSTVKVKE